MKKKKSLRDVIFNCALQQHNGLDSIIVSEATLEKAVIEWLKEQRISSSFKISVEKQFFVNAIAGKDYRGVY
jgi:hypothetical protein